MPTRILITGALGHIGSRFIHHLRPGEYDEVVLLDNLATQRYASLFNLPERVPFRLVEEDVCKADLGQVFDGIDVVIHLAAITDAANSFEIKDQVERVNFHGTQRVAEACLTCGCKLVFLSTTSVYGTTAAVVDETCSVDELKPQSPYAASKLRSEQHLQLLGRRNGLRFVICRFGTIYGASIGMRFHTAINKFVWQASTGQPLTIWRTALSQKRPYLELGDAVRVLDYILEMDRFDNQIYNVLTENATVAQVIELIHNYIPDAEVEYVDSQIMNQLSYEVSCDEFRSLGFEFRGSLAGGISETVDLIRELRGARRTWA